MWAWPSDWSPMSRIEVMGAGLSRIAELENAIQSRSKDKRVETPRRVTDLFVTAADRLNDQQIFDFARFGRWRRMTLLRR